jgi:hypothetical protein
MTCVTGRKWWHVLNIACHRGKAWQTHEMAKKQQEMPGWANLVLLLWELLAEIRGLLRQLAGSNILLCQHSLSRLLSKGWAQEQRGLTLYTLASRLQKQKARSNPYMVVFNFIGYFTLVLCDFPLPGTTWPSTRSDFSDFISLVCHPYLSATFSGLRPRLLSSDPPPCYNERCKGRHVAWPWVGGHPVN